MVVSKWLHYNVYYIGCFSIIVLISVISIAVLTKITDISYSTIVNKDGASSDILLLLYIINIIYPTRYSGLILEIIDGAHHLIRYSILLILVIRAEI